MAEEINEVVMFKYSIQDLRTFLHNEDAILKYLLYGDTHKITISYNPETSTATVSRPGN